MMDTELTVAQSVNERQSLRPARVALFTDTFIETNGAAHTLRKVAEQATTLGWEFDVFTYGEHFQTTERAPGKTYHFDHRLSVGYYENLRLELLPDSRIDRAFWDQMKMSPYEVIHIATPGGMGFTGRRLAHQAGLPVVGTYHTHFADYAAMRLPLALKHLVTAGSWALMRAFYGRCKSVLFPTVGAAEIARRNGFEMRLGIFSRGVDTGRFSPSHRKRNDRRPLVSYVGRLAPEKNVRILPDILNDQDAEVQIVGDGPERGWIERRLPKASFLGYQHGASLSEAYANSDILLFPSLTDTFGNVVLEAMSSGVVPIVMEAPGPRDFVTDGVNALIANDMGGMREALKRLLAHPDERSRMASAARAFAESRDWARATRTLFESYREAASATA
ncbi:MAG: glycosyltransferase family 1 protein [Fimbriimonadaceae bacterium]|nr:glycosyltransferase family 1 protein [Fimbriimonadaceae bacterium]